MKKIILGIALFVLAFLFPCGLIVYLVSTSQNDRVFTGPGSMEFSTEKPATYYVWSQFRGTHNGKVFARDEELPSGTTFVLKKDDTATEIPFEEDSSISSTWGDSEKKSIGYYKIEQPGHYTLTVSNLSEERLFAWGPSLMGNLALFMGGLFVTILFTLAFVVGGIILAILGIVEYSKKSSTAVP